MNRFAFGAPLLLLAACASTGSTDTTGTDTAGEGVRAASTSSVPGDPGAAQLPARAPTVPTRARASGRRAHAARTQ